MNSIEVVGLKDVLEKVKRGELNVSEAERLLRILSVETLADAALDVSRERRRCVPEIVLGEGKSLENLCKAAEVLLRENGRVLISRIDEEKAKHLLNALSKNGCHVRYYDKAKLLSARLEGYRVQKLRGKIGILTAGTSDLSVAEEVRAVAEEMGCETLLIADVGIAGIHRTLSAVKKLIEEDVDVAVVVAGMEGALPSVVAGLVDFPVIGVPTSVGYGFESKGRAALKSMLQSCALGLTAVNVDNGVGAAIAAYLILKVKNKEKKGETSHGSEQPP